MRSKMTASGALHSHRTFQRQAAPSLGTTAILHPSRFLSYLPELTLALGLCKSRMAPTWEWIDHVLNEG